MKTTVALRDSYMSAFANGKGLSVVFLVHLFQALCCAVGQTSSKRNLVFVVTLVKALV